MEKKTGKKTWIDHVLTLILILAVAVFCYAGYQLFQIYMEYREGTEEYQELAQIAVTTVEKAAEENEIAEEESVQKAKEKQTGKLEGKSNEELEEKVREETKEKLEEKVEEETEEKPEKKVEEETKEKPEETFEKEAEEQLREKSEKKSNEEKLIKESVETSNKENHVEEDVEREAQEIERIEDNTENILENDNIREVFQCVTSGMQQLVNHFIQFIQESQERYAIQPPIEVDFEVLQKINPDIVGWIYVEALENISYPVVKGEDNEKYLHTTYEGKYNFAGTIFIDENNSRDFQDCNTIVYGHNMKNGSMFGKLKKFVSEPETYENSRYFWILTPDAKYRYEIIAAYTTALNSDTYTLFYSPGIEVLDYLKNIQENSAIETNVRNLSVRDKVVTLSTCTGNDATRFVVQGVRVNVAH